MILARLPHQYVSVEDAAKVLRVSPWTLYRNIDEVPHTRIGNLIRVHVSFLMCEYVPGPSVTKYDRSYDHDQLEFEYDVPVRTVRLYRDGTARLVGDYETSLSKKKWRSPLD